MPQSFADPQGPWWLDEQKLVVIEPGSYWHWRMPTVAEIHWQTWEAVSPDLTRNDKAKQQPSGGSITLDITSVEYYDTVFAFTESPLQKDLLWAGTDDGLVHVSRDGGKAGTNVTPQGLPEWSTISQIDASPTDAGGALLAVDRHKLDDNRPYLYRTSDFGKTWSKLTSGIPDGAFVRAARQDPQRRELLYAATELGVYVSFDGGQHWQSLQLNLPVTPVTDLIVKDDDLAISTNGRSFWILDDVAPLRQATSELLAKGMHLYAPAPSVRLRYPEFVERHRPVGTSPSGAFLDYWFAAAPAGEVTLEIQDEQGRRVRNFSSVKKATAFEQPPEWPDQLRPPELIPAAAGMNRFPWNLRYESPLETPGLFYEGTGPEGPIVLPGKYRLILSANGKSESAELVILADPRVKAPRADLQKAFELQIKVRDRITDLHRGLNQIRSVESDLESIRRRLAGTGQGAGLLAAVERLEAAIKPIEAQLTQVKLKSSEGTLRYPVMLNEQLATFSSLIESADAAPTQAMLDVFASLDQRLATALGQWHALLESDVPALDAQARKENLPLIVVKGE